MNKIIVLAYSLKAFSTFLYENRISPEEQDNYVFGDPFHYKQPTHAEKVIVYGTFWDRPDAKELYDQANARVK